MLMFHCDNCTENKHKLGYGLWRWVFWKSWYESTSPWYGHGLHINSSGSYILSRTLWIY